MTKKSNLGRVLLVKLVGFALVLGGLATGLYFLKSGPVDTALDTNRLPLKVLSYDSFVASWGPGPELAQLFEKETGIKVEYQESPDAGLLLKKMELFPVDVVIGFDQLTLSEARKGRKWLPLPEEVKATGARWLEPEFLPFDWGPMAFVYRQGEITPPTSLTDLLDARFKGAIALQDPRTSTPGLQFLYWVLDEMGVEEGFAYLAKLKTNLHSVSGSWSTAYGVFTKKEAKLAFSYLTSPVYHWSEEKDESYQPAVFASGHPVQIEYAAVPESCSNCVAARQFISFLLSAKAQEIIMKKNFMMPVVDSVVQGSLFAKLPVVQIREIKSLPQLNEKKAELLERWRQLGL